MTITTDQQIKDIAKEILEHKDLGLFEILDITYDQGFTIGEMLQTLKMVTVFGHNYIDNTTGWFPITRNSLEDTEPLISLYWIYAALGITFETIENSKGYIPEKPNSLFSPGRHYRSMQISAYNLCASYKPKPEGLDLYGRKFINKCWRDFDGVNVEDKIK